jgi:hypothetical protein
LWLSVVYGNTAYDGATDGSIRLNRWALPRSEASVANTISHNAIYEATG